MASEAAARTFFSSASFAVVGASSDTAKYGHKIFNWYIRHGLPVLPINPNNAEIEASSPPPARASAHQAYPTWPSVASLPAPANTSISIVTPPAVSRRVLSEAAAAGVPAVWLQPGSFDDDALRFARAEFKAAVAGPGGCGDEGWCILMDGERAARAAGKL